MPRFQSHFLFIVAQNCFLVPSFFTTYAIFPMQLKYFFSDNVVLFYQGAKVHISAAKKRIICSDGKSYELKLTEDTYNLSSDANQLLGHAQLCLEHCKKLECCFTQLQHEIPQNSLFPVTVSRRPANIHCPKDKSPSQSRYGPTLRCVSCFIVIIFRAAGIVILFKCT